MRTILKLMLASLAITSFLNLLGIFWSTNYDWPDNVHTDYGLPLTWATHTTKTLVGPSNIWVVNIVALGLIIILWSGLSAIVTTVLARIVWRRGSARKSAS